MKVCSKCKFEKDESEFHKCAKVKSGVKSECKCCCAIRAKPHSKKYYSVHKAEVNKKAREWEANNKERKLILKRQYRKENPKKANDARDKWRLDCKDKFLEHERVYSKIIRDSLGINYLKQLATIRGFSKEDIKNKPIILETIKLLIKGKRLCKSKTQNS